MEHLLTHPRDSQDLVAGNLKKMYKLRKIFSFEISSAKKCCGFPFNNCTKKFRLTETT